MGKAFVGIALFCVPIRYVWLLEVYHTTFDWPSDELVQQRLVKPEDLSEEETSRKLLEYHRNFPGVFQIYQKILKSINADQPCMDVLSQGKYVPLWQIWWLINSYLKGSSQPLETVGGIRSSQNRWLPTELFSLVQSLGFPVIILQVRINADYRTVLVAESSQGAAASEEQMSRLFPPESLLKGCAGAQLFISRRAGTFHKSW